MQRGPTADVRLRTTPKMQCSRTAGALMLLRRIREAGWPRVAAGAAFQGAQTPGQRRRGKEFGSHSFKQHMKQIKWIPMKPCHFHDQ
eukprot:1137796-Pelagomonas_calceolata.AAC.8